MKTIDKVHVVNWILTRRCNLKCSYCRISRNYDSPREYPPLKFYSKHEISAENICNALRKFKIHNPNCFHIFYGGEPLLRSDLPKIIKYCNEEDILYTIITNNTKELEPFLKNIFNYSGEVRGLTSSIDPIVMSDDRNSDIFKKSFDGLERLSSYKHKVKDLVAEVTVTNESIDFLYPLVKDLTNRGISSSITFVDIAKNNYYDFSNITDEDFLVYKSDKLLNIINRIRSENLDVHMLHSLLPKLYDILPSNLDCKIENNIHNLTIDSDGSIRLCLRIRGVALPNNFSVCRLFDEDYNLVSEMKNILEIDKRKYCLKCNWSCMIMTQLISDGENVDTLTHSERRK